MISIFAATCSTFDRRGVLDSSGLPKACANQNTLENIFLWGFVVIGALAVLFLVIGGTRYALSGGDPEKVKKSRNEILYSMIGLVIAAFGAIIVKFVIGRLP